MTIKKFEKRVKFNRGYDRGFDEWKILDIHEISEFFLERYEVDFKKNRTFAARKRRAYSLYISSDNFQRVYTKCTT
jgi:hypothetical protein